MFGPGPVGPRLTGGGGWGPATAEEGRLGVHGEGVGAGSRDARMIGCRRNRDPGPLRLTAKSESEH